MRLFPARPESLHQPVGVIGHQLQRKIRNDLPIPDGILQPLPEGLWGMPPDFINGRNQITEGSPFFATVVEVMMDGIRFPRRLHLYGSTNICLHRIQLASPVEESRYPDHADP